MSHTATHTTVQPTYAVWMQPPFGVVGAGLVGYRFEQNKPVSAHGMDVYMGTSLTNLSVAHEGLDPMIYDKYRCYSSDKNLLVAVNIAAALCGRVVAILRRAGTPPSASRRRCATGDAKGRACPPLHLTRPRCRGRSWRRRRTRSSRG